MKHQNCEDVFKRQHCYMNTAFRYNHLDMLLQTLAVSCISASDVGESHCKNGYIHPRSFESAVQKYIRAGRLPLFECGKECLCDRIIERRAACGKGLLNAILLQKFTKCRGNILPAPITVKGQALRIASFCISSLRKVVVTRRVLAVRDTDTRRLCGRRGQ